MTATPSLRRRVTLTVLGLFAILLVLVGVLVDVALGAQLGRDLNSRLSDRVSRAEQLADQGAPPPQLVSQLQGQDIRVRVVTADGDSYGDPGLGPLGPGDAPQSPPKPPTPPVESVPGDARAGAPGPPTPPDKTSTTVTKVLSDGNTVVLVGDTTAITDVRRQLRVVMAVAAVAAMIVAALVLLGGIATALRPLDRMTTLARRITAGDRGSRLAPNRPRTELGRAAAPSTTCSTRSRTPNPAPAARPCRPAGPPTRPAASSLMPPTNSAPRSPGSRPSPSASSAPRSP